MTVYNCDMENSMVLDTYTPDAHDDPHAQDRDDCDELLTGTKGPVPDALRVAPASGGDGLEVRFTHAEALRVLDLCRLDVQTSIATRSADPATVSAMLKLCERVNARGAVNER